MHTCVPFPDFFEGIDRWMYVWAFSDLSDFHMNTK